jgi:predicted ATPase
MFTSLRLERFKSFKDAELKLGPFTVLIGANASGKSNIRDAFRFLHGIGRGYGLAEIIGEKYGEGGERVWTGIRGGIPEITFQKSRTFDLSLQFEMPPKVSANGRPRRGPDVQSAYRIECEYLQKHTAMLNKKESLSVQGLHPVSFNAKASGRESMSVDIQVDLRRQQVLLQGLRYPRTGSVLSSFRNLQGMFMPHDKEGNPESLLAISFLPQAFHPLADCRFFDFSLDALRQSSTPGQSVLSDNGRNLSSVLHTMCADARRKTILLSWIQELTPMDAVDLEFQSDPAGNVLATLVEKNGQRTTLASASDGTLRFLAFLAAFLGPHRSSFYFFEELENGIHPTRLGLLLDLVENQVKNKGIQVVATTHSPQLLGRLSDASLEHASLIYRLEDQPDARIIRVLDMPHARRIIKKSGAAHLAAEGWFESTAYYMQPDPDDEKVSPRPTRRRTSGVVQ